MCVNFPKAEGLWVPMYLRFCLTTEKDVVVLISPKCLVRGLRNTVDSVEAPMKISVCVNFPKAGGLWDPT